MLAPLVSAGIILSYKCNSRCRHCLYCCSNKWSDWADIELVRKIYEGTLRTARYIHGFHLAGGEAFLNFPLLLESMRLATEYGIPIDYIETNAGWYVDEESAICKLKQLREAGLNCLLISASPFHAEFIPIEKTLGAIKASIKVFGEHGTIVWLPEFLNQLTRISTKGKIKFENYVNHVGRYGAERAAAYGGQLIAGGRSPYTLSEYLPQKPIESFFNGNCKFELLQSARGHFDPYGNIIPGVCSGISVGDANDLVRAYNDFNLSNYPIIEILCTEGIKGLYEMAVADYNYKPKTAYAAKCDLCVDIRRHLVMCNAPFVELRPKQFYEQI